MAESFGATEVVIDGARDQGLCVEVKSVGCFVDFGVGFPLIFFGFKDRHNDFVGTFKPGAVQRLATKEPAGDPSKLVGGGGVYAFGGTIVRLIVA